MHARFAKALAAVALFNGVLYLGTAPEAHASNDEDAKKYTKDLKTSKDAKVRVAALNELGRLAAIMTSYAGDALPSIYAALEDKDAGVRAAAAACLGACDQPADKAIPALVKILKDDKEESAKIGALKGLTAMGTAAKTALPEIRKLTADKKSALGKAAQQAAKAINKKE